MALAGVTLAVLAACGLAMQALTIRMATRRRGRSADVLLVVMLVNGVVLVPLVLLFDPDPTLTPRAIVSFAGAGVAGTLLGRAFFYAGIERVGASRAEPIKASMPIHATILAILLLGERVSIPQFGGILLIVVGIALLSWEGRATDRLLGTETPWVGLALPFIAAFFFGMEPIFASFGLREGTSTWTGLLIKTIAGLTVYTLYLTARDSLPAPSDFPREDLKWYVFAGLASTTFLLAYYSGLSVSEVSIVVPIMQMSPLIVVAVSAVFLRRLETVTPKLVFAALVIVGGGVTITLTG